MILQILSDTCLRASRALLFTAFFVCICTLVFSAIIYFLESGTFQVTPMYPNGAYLREDIFGTPRNAISPFTGFSVSMYYVIVTLTTLGFGDNGELVPTSPGGRAVACLLCFSGVLVLALPISVIGQKFVELYRAYVKRAEDIDVLSPLDVKRATLRAAVGTKPADVTLLDKLDMCMHHEKHCTAITQKAILAR